MAGPTPQLSNSCWTIVQRCSMYARGLVWQDWNPDFSERYVKFANFYD
ncbi:hypothetical protein CBM2633_B60321 [Cupriavidus taiwanensis]|nr:hypothetical protein CBM2633_B60321 [Cupriavidus taiwanensis]